MCHVSTDQFHSKDKRVKVTRKLLELALFPTKDIVEVKASATAPPTSSKDTSKDIPKATQECFFFVPNFSKEVSSILALPPVT